MGDLALFRAAGSSAARRNDAEKVGRLEAGAADQGAVDIGDCQQFFGVLGLHRATVEETDLAALFPTALKQRLAQEAVHFGNIACFGGEAAADGPHRLIGDHRVGGAHVLGQGLAELPPDDGER